MDIYTNNHSPNGENQEKRTPLEEYVLELDYAYAQELAFWKIEPSKEQGRAEYGDNESS